MAETDGNEWVLLDTDLTARLAILPSAMSHLYFVLNEPGSGELKIPLESNAAALIESGQFAQASYRGGARGGFFVDNIQKMQADASEGGGKWLSISGRGGLALLEDAIVWDDGTTASTREFASMTKAAILITLIDEAQARGGLAALTYDFSATDDSDSVAWDDSESYQLSVGTSLLDVLRQFAKTGIDFDIVYSSGSFVLSAYKNGKGTDKSETIYFRTGVNCEEVKSDERGDAIKNALRVAYKAGNVTITDGTSITNRRRREKLLDARVAQTASSATTYGSAILANSKDPRKGISVKIYDGVGPRVFLDYDIGDYIMLDVEGTETSYRVLGIQLDWDGKDYSNVVVELNTLLYENEIRMAQDIDWLLDQWETARDADLLEVSYWAAIGDANMDYSSFTMLRIVGDSLYIVNAAVGGTRLNRYGLSTGIWEVLTGNLGTINCDEVVGTTIYLGGSTSVYKFDTTTDTLTTIAAVSYAAVPALVGVYMMTVDGTFVFMAGAFDTIDGTAANGIIKYNTVADTWATLADEASFNFPVAAITSNMVFHTDGNLYAGGQMWNGTVFSNTGKPGTVSYVYKMISYGTDILIGTEDGLYIYDGVSWEVFGGTISGHVRDIAIYLTDIYVVGTFTDIGNRIARYSGGTWWQLGTGLNASTTQIELVDDDVYVLGSFTTAGDKVANNIAAYFNNFEALVNYLENSSSSFNMGAAIHAATASAISDSDEVPFWEDVSNALRKITWANIKTTLKTYFDTLYVALTGNQTIAGVKTFSSDPIIPDEAYDATNWNGVLEPPTKNALRDKIETMGLPAGSDTQIQFNDGGVFGGSALLLFNKASSLFDLGGTDGGVGNIRLQGDNGNASAPNGDATIIHELAYGTTGNGPLFKGVYSRGNKATPAAVNAEDAIFRIRAGGYDGAGLVFDTASSGAIQFVANQTFTTTANGTRIDIYTTPDGSTTLTKTLVIGAGGIASNVTANKTLTLTATDNFTLTVPATGTAALLATANQFTVGQGFGVAATTNAAIIAELTTTNTTAVGKWGVSTIVYGNPAGASAELHYGGEFGARSTAGNAQNFTGQFLGGVFRAIHQGTGTMTTAIGGQFRVRTSSTGLITNGYSLYILSANNTSPNTITNQYGLFIADINEGVTLNYSIYTGTGLVRFGDAVSSTGSILSSNATTGIGYTTGAGGTVTQATSKATGVTLNKATGLITMNNAALAAATTVTFTLTSSAIAATDTIILNHASAGTAGAYTLNAQVAAGSATINVRNVTAGSLSEAIVIRYTVIKSVSA